MKLEDRLPNMRRGELTFIVEEAGRVIDRLVLKNKTLVGAGKAICQLMKGESVSFQGLSYMAVGSGDASWDDDNPPEPPPDQTQLLAELGRVATQNAYIEDYVTGEALGTSDGSAGQIFTVQYPPIAPVKYKSFTDEYLGSSDGSASQSFIVDQFPIQAASAVVKVISNPSGSSPVTTEWARVTDFTGSASNSKHYVLSEATGLVTFGDGTNGMIPAKGDTIKIDYIGQERRIKIGGVTWTEVGNLGGYGAADEVFTLDVNTGKIRFGDNTNGKIPLNGSVISADYRTNLPFTVPYETNWLQVTGVFVEGIASGTWRELGIFCNDNADQPNGGYQANCKNIAQINKLANRKVTVVWCALFV